MGLSPTRPWEAGIWSFCGGHTTWTAASLSLIHIYLYKSHWNKEPMVHLCGSRYVDRTEDVTEVKVYSNQPQVSLYVNGRLVGTQEGPYVFRFTCLLYTSVLRHAANHGDLIA